MSYISYSILLHIIFAFMLKYLIGLSEKTRLYPKCSRFSLFCLFSRNGCLHLQEGCSSIHPSRSSTHSICTLYDHCLTLIHFCNCLSTEYCCCICKLPIRVFCHSKMNQYICLLALLGYLLQ